MNSDPNLEVLVAELKADLPSERDGARLRTRLAALGIAAAQGVAGSAAAATATTAAAAANGASAATTATATAAAGIAGAAQASISVMAIKTFAVALVAGAGVMSSARYVQNELSRAEPVASVASVAAPVSPARVAALAVRAAHQEPVERVERAASSSHEDTEAALVGGTPTLARGEHAEKTGLAAPFVEARGSVPSVRDAVSPSANANAATAAPAVAPLVASGSNSTAAFAEPASAATVTAPAASEAAVPPRASATVEPALEATTLRAETALIDRALSALRTSDTALAARLLSQHRARFPDGLLKRERERAERKLAELEAGRGAP